jgi:hypothetical protein
VARESKLELSSDVGCCISGEGGGGGADGLELNPLVGMFVGAFGPVRPRVWFTRLHAHSVDHAGFEVEEIRARYVASGERVREGVDKRKKARAAVWQGKQEMQVVRARVSLTGK